MPGYLPQCPPPPPSASSAFAAHVASAVLDPHYPEQFAWQGNCPATKCYDGDTDATAEEFCGEATTNLCHTAYEDQDHTLTYTLTESLYVASVTIYNKPNNANRLRNYTISVGDSLGALAVCASGFAVDGVDVSALGVKECVAALGAANETRRNLDDAI